MLANVLVPPDVGVAVGILGFALPPYSSIIPSYTSCRLQVQE